MNELDRTLASSHSASSAPFRGFSTPSAATTKPKRKLSGGQNSAPASTTKGGKPTVFSVFVEGDDGGIEMKNACDKLFRAHQLRDKYKSIDKGQREPGDKLTPPITMHVDDGIFCFSEQRTGVISWEQFYDDVQALMDVIHNPFCQATCKYRLQVLEEKFNIYKLSNSELEEGADRYRRGGGVFADCTKVDNHIHLMTSANALNLLEHIQLTYERDGDEIVRIVGERKEAQSLRRMFEVSDIQDPQQLTVEGLGLHPSNEKRQTRFDVLDPEINRAGRGSADILRLFLTRDTMNQGRYFAEAVRPVLLRNECRSKYIQCTESVVEILGLAEDEWDKLSKWFIQNNLDECNRTNRWVISLPRAKIRQGAAAAAAENTSFEFHQKHLENLFLPLFLATLAPEDPRNADVALFLQHVGCILVTSDEEFRDGEFVRKRRRPAEVPWSENVCDLYFAYYVWANLVTLNAFRKRKGLNMIQFRAVAGERSTQLDALVYSYLLGDAITHGLLLEQHPVLQFLYGLHRIGICMSPLAQNALSVAYMENPLPLFFRRGIFVTLCTEHPLFFHHSQDPLLEEYGTCNKLYKLSAVDMCELAHNSVMISSFPDAIKGQWLGDPYIHEGVKGNSIEYSNLPTSRLELRFDSWASEFQIIVKAVGNSSPVQDSAFISSRVPYLVTDPNVNFPRIVFAGPFERDAQHAQVAQQLHRALELRKQYVWGARNINRNSIRSILQQHEHIENAFKRNDNFDEDEWMYKTVEGVVVPHEVHQIPRLPKDMFRFEEFRIHVQEMRNICDHIHVKSFATRRLNLLEHKFKLHLAVNHSVEAGSTAEKVSQNRDFYQATKVDTNVRMESGMTARHLLNFIISKANNNGDDIVSQEKGKEPQTLRQLLVDLNISPNFLTVDDLNVQVDANTASGGSQQFTPEGRDPLLTLLLKTDNQMKGRYFAELTKLTFENFKRDKFTFAENRLPIHGANANEWSLLSDWFDTHGMASFNNQWMIQIPRIYSYLRKKGKITNFAEYLEHIFQPLWLVSLHPSRNPRLFHFVNHVSGFDCVEDERKVDMPMSAAQVPPQEWTGEEDPPYNYYLYYIWANIYSLNEFRQKRSFSTFSFRPSCGEMGPVDHVIGGFLIANAVNYGVTLRDEPSLQYLFYLAQIGVAVCPLSNNTKVLDFLDNPFPKFFRRGLNVSLSTDGPLQFHHTQEPLLEEYSIASKVWKFSPNDMCEIARNSVMQSGFDWKFKQERLGELYFLSSSRSNDATRTHLSDVRVAYRYDTYHTEVSLLEHVSGLRFERAMSTIEEEQKKLQEWQETKRKKDDATLGGIIDSQQDEADIQKLNAQRALMIKQMEELKKSLAELQRQNKQLSEKLAEETSKDQAAQQLRRQQEADRISAMSAADAKKHQAAEEDHPFAHSDSSEDDDDDPEHSKRRENEIESPTLSSKGDGSATESHMGLPRLGSDHSPASGGGISARHSVSRNDSIADSFKSTGKPFDSIGLASVGSMRKFGTRPTVQLIAAPESFFQPKQQVPQPQVPLLYHPKAPDGSPVPPPRTHNNVPNSDVSDALQEFMLRSNAELDRMVNGRKASSNKMVRVMSAEGNPKVAVEPKLAPVGRSSSAR